MYACFSMTPYPLSGIFAHVTLRCIYAIYLLQRGSLKVCCCDWSTAHVLALAIANEDAFKSILQVSTRTVIAWSEVGHESIVQHIRPRTLTLLICIYLSIYLFINSFSLPTPLYFSPSPPVLSLYLLYLSPFPLYILSPSLSLHTLFLTPSFSLIISLSSLFSLPIFSPPPSGHRKDRELRVGVGICKSRDGLRTCSSNRIKSGEKV